WLGARRLAGTRATRLCGAAPRSRQPRPPRLALLQPAARIDRIAVAAQLEVQRRAPLAAGVADAGDRVAAPDLRAGVLEQGVVVGVQAHVAVAVVDDQDQAVAGHPFGEHHGAVGHRRDRGARRRADQHARALVAVGHGRPIAGEQVARHRPAQPAYLDRRGLRHRDRRRRLLVRRRRAGFLRPRGRRGRGRGGAAPGGGLLRRGAQAREQLLQRPGVLAQRLLALAPVLVALVEPGHRGLAFAPVAFEFCQLRALAFARRVQRLLLLRDLAFDPFEFGQLRGQRLDPAHAVALQVAVVGERARSLGHLVLREHQLEWRLVADGVGRAQQFAQLAALLRQRRLQAVAAFAQPRQLGLAAGQFGLGFAQAAGRVADLFVGLAQLAAGVAAPAFDLAALGGDVLEFALDLLQLALGLAAALRLRGRGGQRRE